MIALGLRQVQAALNHKADQIQKQFIEASAALDDIGRRLLDSQEEAKEQLKEEQKAARTRQQELAELVNQWRERARAVLTQPGEAKLRAYLNELLAMQDDLLTPSVKHALFLLDATDEELAKLAEAERPAAPQTPAGRLITRARMEFDLRGSDTAVRQRAAVEFANRPGLALQDDIVAEIEAALEDSDPIVREVMLLTAIQLHRFRAMRTADLDQAHESVNRLAALNHPAVIPALVEVLENPRTGYVRGEQGTEETDNGRSRLVALLRLVEWHTAVAQQSVRGRLFDRDEHIVKAAKRALELFPGDWSGPLKGTRKLAGVEEP